MATVDKRTSALPPSLTNVEKESAMTIEKVQRLRVNRVAIIQTLRVEHVLNYLLSASVLTDDDKAAILKPRLGQDKARVLVDLLPQKFPSKCKNWYAKFREALRNPESRSKDVKKKYEMLVEFLDNTIIHIPRPKTPISKTDKMVKEKSFPRYQTLPGISASPWEKGQNESPEHKHKEAFNEDNVEKPSNFASLIQVPQAHFDALQQGMSAEDLAQLESEKIALERIQHVETIYALEKRALLPAAFQFSMSKSVVQFLSDANLYHYYRKYLSKLKLDHNINLLGEISGSFCNYLAALGVADNNELREKATDAGFKLYRMLVEFGDSNKAEFVLLALMQYLSTCSKLENWMALWEGLVCMMSIANVNVDFQQTDANYHLVKAMGDKIKAMSFGLDLLDESAMFCEMSVMMREQGSLQPSYKWAQKALQEVDADNEAGIIDVLCTASSAYALNWDIHKAEQLATEAIRRAKASFGIRHPLYVKALLSYVNYAVDFQPDAKAVEVARVAVAICEKLYSVGGAGSYQSALAHQALAKALMATQQFSREEYHDEAMAALRGAMDCVDGAHPRLAHFKYTLAQSLQWRAMHGGGGDERAASLAWAESEALTARLMYKERWGTYSIKVAQSSSLLGQIYAKMDRPVDAERELAGSVSMYQLTMPASSPLLALAKATLAMFLTTCPEADFQQEYLAPAAILEQALASMDQCGGDDAYVAWVHSCHENLVSLLRSEGLTDRADQAQRALTAWLDAHPSPRSSSTAGAGAGVTWERLHEPPQPLHAFKQQFFGWETAAQIVQRGLRNLKANLVRMKDRETGEKALRR